MPNIYPFTGPRKKRNHLTLTIMTPSSDIFDFNAISDADIETTLQQYGIALKVEEVKRIQNDILNRPPSLTECILWSIQGSEHSSYKSSRPHLGQFVTEGPTVILGAKEDAGIVAIATDKQGHRYCAVMSHESHNHPSQIVPYEGAATGIGGNVRDVMCMGAEVIAVADGLRFGDIASPKTKWIHEGVVAGIAGYGNPIGVPNICGDLYYDEGYNDNCLVTVVTLGIVREDEVIHSAAPPDSDNYDLILIGKPTDNSGFGGASFASLELNEDEKESKKAAVQEPNAFLERHLMKATYALFDILREKGLYDKVGFKDLGAGGIACASVELVDNAGYGAEVHLDQAHISMKNLHPSVILCSETQERFMWVTHPDVTSLILKHYNDTFDLPNVSKGAAARVMGNVRADGQYIVHNNGEALVDAPASQVTKGFLYHRNYKAPVRDFVEPDIPEPEDYNTILLQILSHENIASREAVFETYDKQVQGRTVVESGQSDAGVMQPFNDDSYPEEIRTIGITLATDHNPRYSKIDPYWGAVNAVVESVRNVAAVGATPQAITDCLCFGNPEKEDQMWQFAEAARGVAEACKTIKLKEHPDHPVPIIAGNVSFYNESRNGAIPPSPIVSCLGKLKDVNRVITMSFQQIDSVLLMVGARKDELGGSVYYSLHNELGTNVPQPDPEEVKNQIYALTDCIYSGLILACHDISDGGVAVAIAEMTFANEIGCKVTIPGDMATEKLLFSETGGFALEVSLENVNAVQTTFSRYGLEATVIGNTAIDELLQINNVIQLPVCEAQEAWTNGLREKLK
ncbi:MAG: phosphoribosylformylglycinamidine synthase subunit PurL [Candidatus Marinimicrobia bacterium]|nr:phosphoribosylformylglycinamidine synthase subunit PurL [Candidatus Neomarinimicrobiota bacterium]